MACVDARHAALTLRRCVLTDARCGAIVLTADATLHDCGVRAARGARSVESNVARARAGAELSGFRVSALVAQCGSTVAAERCRVSDGGRVAVQVRRARRQRPTRCDGATTDARRRALSQLFRSVTCLLERCALSAQTALRAERDACCVLAGSALCGAAASDC